MTAPMIWIALDEPDFRRLVAGDIVEASARLGGAASDAFVTVRIVLSDIGFDRMSSAILSAMAEEREEEGRLAQQGDAS